MNIKEEKINNLIFTCEKLIAHLDIVLGGIKLSGTAYLRDQLKKALEELNERRGNC